MYFRYNHIHTGHKLVIAGFPNGSTHIKQFNGIITGQQHSAFETNIVYNVELAGAPLFRHRQVICVFYHNPHNNNTNSHDVSGFATPIARYNTIEALLHHSSKQILYFPGTFGVEYHKTYPEWVEFAGCYKTKNNPKTIKKAPKHTSTVKRSGHTSVDNSSTKGGLHITKVHTTGLFYKTGITKGDLLCKINDLQIDCYGELPTRWMNHKMTLRNLLYTSPIGRLIPVEYWSHKKNKMVQTRFLMRQNMLPIRYIYPNLETIDYEIVGGMTVMMLTENHLENKNLQPRLQKYRLIEHCHHPKIIISYVISGSFLSSLQLLDDQPYIIKELNGLKVSTMDEFRTHISKIITYNTISAITVLTEDDNYIVLPVDLLIQDDANPIKKTYIPPNYKYL